jgi:hypothetical protein
MTTIYYLPGWGGSIQLGLGKGLMGRGHAITGRETRDEFKNFTFTEQVETVGEDLKENFWSTDSLVVAVSFGAYLFLHAQASLPPYPGKVLLLSPIVGGFADESTGRMFSPPKDGFIRSLAENGTFPAPLNCEVHTGEQDWQSHPELVGSFFSLLGIGVTVAKDRGHTLGEDYVSPVLDFWLPRG